VRARATGDERVYARALDEGAQDEFALGDPPPARGWRAFVRGAVAELHAAGYPLVGARLQIEGDLPQGAGLSSSAALTVALCLALLALGGARVADRVSLARLCSRVENEWAGARTGLLDQLASLCGLPDTALLIDFQTLALEPVPPVLEGDWRLATLAVEPVPLRLEGGWRLVTLDSGQTHAHADSGYNERRAECARACELLGVPSLRDASPEAIAGLPEPLRRRAGHVLGENERVRAAVAALRAGDLPALGVLLSASHTSLRERYEVSTPALDAAVARLLDAGAAGARLIGGGFGGHVLGLLPPGAQAPAGAREVRAGAGAHLLSSSPV
jgi:galactokinase